MEFDFSQFNNQEFKERFKEDSVREVLIAPLLNALGFGIKNDKKSNVLEMLLSKTSKTQIQIGSNKTIDTDLTPDYTLFVEGKRIAFWTLKPQISKSIKTAKPKNKQKAIYLPTLALITRSVMESP